MGPPHWRRSASVPIIYVSVIAGPEKQNSLSPVSSFGDNTSFCLQFQAHSDVTLNTVPLQLDQELKGKTAYYPKYKIGLTQFSFSCAEYTYLHSAETQSEYTKYTECFRGNLPYLARTFLM
jgi:hypothetical protein